MLVKYLEKMGKVSDVQISSFLTAMSLKGESVSEIVGSSVAMREHASKVELNTPVFEIVGTGGDNSKTFNISTTSAFVIASAGVKIAKHGNRSASSLSGSADCLEKLGVNIDENQSIAKKMIEKTGFCFLFANKYHTAMRHVGPIRKELKIKTVFNIIGPLNNPAYPKFGVFGVYSASLLDLYAESLIKLGLEHGAVVFADDVMDEVSISSPTSIVEINNGKISRYKIKPEDFGYKTALKADVVGGDPSENAEITRNILIKKLKGPKRDIVCLNSGVSLYIAGKAKSIDDGVRLAEELIDSGKAAKKLEEIIEVSNSLK